MNSNILINEFLPNPKGADKGWEWIEIVNISENEIDISNWEIQVAGIKFSRAFKFPIGSKIKSGEYLLICEEFVENCNFYTTQLAIQNGGKETDGVRILNEKLEVIDTVLYDTTNSNNLLNDFSEIEKDQNIIKMPEEGCSLARRNFLDTNYSIQDFFTTCSPTPGKENFEQIDISISEVGENFIEFYSSKIPTDLERWYVLDGEKKVFLKNNLKNNFFFLEIMSKKEINLYSPEDILKDFFSKKSLSKNYTYCRLNNLSDEEFVFCENTKGEKNELKIWKPMNVFEVMQLPSENVYIINPCIMYKHENNFVISDESAAIGIECENCIINECVVGEISSFFKFNILEKKEHRDIKIDFVKKEKISDFLNKVVFLEGQYTKSGFSTEVGIVNVSEKVLDIDYKYIFKGILVKQKNESLTLEYPILIKKENIESFEKLENTGDSILILIFFFILPFLIAKIFAKLSTIKFKI